MTLTPALGFLAGLIAMGQIIASLFFLRFWSRTGEKLFIAFAVAFGLMALNQALVLLLAVPREEQSGFYLLRLLAFLVIIGAILAKNLGAKR